MIEYHFADLTNLDTGVSRYARVADQLGRAVYLAEELPTPTLELSFDEIKNLFADDTTYDNPTIAYELARGLRPQSAWAN